MTGDRAIDNDAQGQVTLGLASLDQLRAALSARWRLFGFASAMLERRYNDDACVRRARSRAAMFTLAVVVFGLAPVYGPQLLGTPPQMRHLFQMAELGFIVPLSLLGILLNLRFSTSAWASGYTAAASVVFVALLIALRRVAIPAGFEIPFETVAISLIVVTLMSGLRAWLTLAVLLLATAALLISEYQIQGTGERFWWSVVAAFVTCVFATITEVTLDDASRRAWLSAQIAELSGMRDALTGLPNRAWFERDAGRVLAQARREQVPIAVILFDIDHFKQLNDSSGHAAGDDCLRRIGRLLIERYALRPLDLRARIGGEEFVLLLYDADTDGARQVAGQIVRDVRSLGIANPGALPDVITVSAGLEHAVPQAGEDVWKMVSRADARLYDAKRTGRNRWCAAP